MTTRVLYQFQESKKGMPDGGEDRLVVTDDFVAVIDGATSKSGETFDGKTGGLLAADSVADAVRRLPRAIDAFSAVAHLTRAVHEHVIDRYVPHMNAPDYTGDRPNASVVLYSAERREIWRVGDSHFRMGEDATNHGKKEIDTINSKLRADYIKAMLARGVATVESLKEDDLGRKLILPVLTAQALLMNNPDTPLGYGVIDGRAVPEKFIEVYKMPEKAGGSSVILASDGVLGDLYRNNAASDMAKSLESQLAYYREDPLMIGKHASTKGVAKGQKWHDDVTVVEFTV